MIAPSAYGGDGLVIVQTVTGHLLVGPPGNAVVLLREDIGKSANDQ